MTDEGDGQGRQIFWCNTNRDADRPDALPYSARMHIRGFAAVWSYEPHPAGLFNYYTHMWRVRRGDRIVMYANRLGVIAVGSAKESRLEILGPDHPDRLRDYADEGQNEQEWRIPVEWLKWDEANPCQVEHLLGAFIEITDSATHGDRLRAIRNCYPGAL